MDRNSENLESLIISLLRKSGSNGLSKTQLIKLVFFSDLIAVKNNMPLITQCSYITDQYGVVDYSIWDAAVRLSASGDIVIKEESNYYGTPRYTAKIVNDTFGEIPSNLQKIVDIIWLKYGSMTASELGVETKRLVAMDDEWQNNIPVDPRDIAYEESDEFVNGCKEALKKYPEGYSEPKSISEYLRDLKLED